MRHIQKQKLVNNLQFITLNHETQEGCTISFLTFYIPKPITRSSTSIDVYDLLITSIPEFLEYNSKYKWITKVLKLRDIEKNPDNYSITIHTDEESLALLSNLDNIYLPEIVRREIAPVRDADDTVVYYHNLNFSSFLLPFTPKQIYTIQEYNKIKDTL